MDHPYREHLALIGDAAATSDPTWGQGMSQTLRDVRVLSEQLLVVDDWDAADFLFRDSCDPTVEIPAGGGDQPSYPIEINDDGRLTIDFRATGTED